MAMESPISSFSWSREFSAMFFGDSINGRAKVTGRGCRAPSFRCANHMSVERCVGRLRISLDLDPSGSHNTKPPKFAPARWGIQSSHSRLAAGWGAGRVKIWEKLRHCVFLIGGFKHFLFSIIYGIILPIDFHIFQDVFLTTNQVCSTATTQLMDPFPPSVKHPPKRNHGLAGNFHILLGPSIVGVFNRLI